MTRGAVLAIAAVVGAAGTAAALVYAARARRERETRTPAQRQYPPGVDDRRGPWIYMNLPPPWENTKPRWT